MNSPDLCKYRPSLGWETITITSLLALVCLLAWPGMTAPLIWDDVRQVKYDEMFTSWKDCFGKDSFGLFRPTKNLIFHALRGHSLFVWHLVCLASYLSATLALYVLLRRLLGSFVWAVVAATLWATCPTQVSTTVWTSCANISVAIAFSCACVALHDRSREESGHCILNSTLAGLCLLLALFSYETAVATPVFCVLVDWLRKRPLFSRPAIARYAMLGAITVFYLLLRAHYGSKHTQYENNFAFLPGTQPWQLSLSAPWLLWRHLSMWLMPAGRIEFFSTYLWGLSAPPWELATAWVLLFLIIVAILFARKRQPWVAFGLLWYLAASFPSSNLIPIWAGPIEDYYVVFPSIGLAIAVAGCAKAILEWTTKKRAEGESSSHRVVGASILLTLLCWRLMCLPLFWLQADLWNRPVELYLREDLTRPHQFQLQIAAATTLLRQAKFKEAGELAANAYETAPWFPNCSMILGSVALENSNYDEAEKRFHEAIAKTPAESYVRDYCTIKLAESLKRRGSKPEIVQETLLPLLRNRKSSEHLEAIYLQIDAFKAAGQMDDARNTIEKAMRIHPDIADFAGLLSKIDKKSPLPPPNPSK